MWVQAYCGPSCELRSQIRAQVHTQGDQEIGCGSQSRGLQVGPNLLMPTTLLIATPFSRFTEFLELIDRYLRCMSEGEMKKESIATCHGRRSSKNQASILGDHRKGNISILLVNIKAVHQGIDL